MATCHGRVPLDGFFHSFSYLWALRRNHERSSRSPRPSCQWLSYSVPCRKGCWWRTWRLSRLPLQISLALSQDLRCPCLVFGFADWSICHRGSRPNNSWLPWNASQQYRCPTCPGPPKHPWRRYVSQRLLRMDGHLPNEDLAWVWWSVQVAMISQKHVTTVHCC